MPFSYQKIKPILAITFYLIAALTIFGLQQSYPAGPCNPDPGFLVILLLIPVSVIFFLISLYQTMQINRSNWITAMIHLIFAISA
jgi:hypothetical protein